MAVSSTSIHLVLGWFFFFSFVVCGFWIMGYDEQEPLLATHNTRGSLNTEPKQEVDVAAKPRVNVKERLVSLDAVRGLTVAVMIFVDDAGGSLQERVDHSPWNDVTLADFGTTLLSTSLQVILRPSLSVAVSVVMPFFLFMVGMSMSMSFRRYQEGLLWKIIKRTAKLFIIGLATQGINSFPDVGFTGFDLKYIRIPGILQRIAWAYFVVSLTVLYFPKINVDRYSSQDTDILISNR
jgi:hypothetical protein